ncbi:MAG: DegT/DnrJ/EryC1/StrS family aminotransferase, partial [Crenarchaeota archaeon]|nr:DegT/DnrJ/EryC1/StrS family aminotransferase [Thermoproteota archaeon]
LKAQYENYKDEINAAIQSVLDSSNFIMGQQVFAFEQALSDFTGSYAITCANGTDALMIALMASGIGPGDEVITTPFTFIATAEMIAHIGAKPVFVDISEKDFNIDVTKIESAITPKTKAIIPVSLYGQPSDMDIINEIAKKHGLKVIEDAAQSFGATYKGKRSCNLSELATTSFFPAKTLGCYGDGGAVFTQNPELAEKIKSLRNHGQVKRYYHKYLGANSRLDTIQAAILSVKIKYFEEEIVKRQKIAEHYTSMLKNHFITPKIQNDRTSVWAQYTIRVKNRDQLQERLKEKGIPTAVHYPRPLHLQEAFAFCGGKEGDFPVAEKMAGEVMSIPMSAYLSALEQDYICNELTNINQK